MPKTAWDTDPDAEQMALMNDMEYVVDGRPATQRAPPRRLTGCVRRAYGVAPMADGTHRVDAPDGRRLSSRAAAR